MKAYGQVQTFLTQLALAAIAFYQAALRPLNLWGCKFYPTCSDYARQAIESRGLWTGLALAGWRLLRCRPGTFGGYDPVPDKGEVGFGSQEQLHASRLTLRETQWQN